MSESDKRVSEAGKVYSLLVYGGKLVSVVSNSGSDINLSFMNQDEGRFVFFRSLIQIPSLCLISMQNYQKRKWQGLVDCS